jgi:uncharacterized protein YbaR (Trm112 family)
MWKRFASTLRCSLCRGPLQLAAFEEHDATCSTEHREVARRRGIAPEVLQACVDTGVLTCAACSIRFPIVHGLPVLLPYITPMHRELESAFGDRLARLPDRGAFPDRPPV